MEWPWGNEDRGQVQGALAAPGVSEPGLPHTFSQTVHQGQWLDKGSFAARPHHCTDQDTAHVTPRGPTSLALPLPKLLVLPCPCFYRFRPCPLP